MVDFGMELYAVQVAFKVLDAAYRGVVRLGNFLEATGDDLNMITVAHPDRAVTIDKKAVKKRAGRIFRQKVGMTILALACRHDPATEMVTHQLHAIADTQHGDPHFEEFFLYRRCAPVINGLRPPGKDDPRGIECLDLSQAHIKRMQLAVDMRFTHPSGNQLGVLRSEVEDQNLFRMDIHINRGLGAGDW